MVLETCEMQDILMEEMQDILMEEMLRFTWINVNFAEDKVGKGSHLRVPPLMMKSKESVSYTLWNHIVYGKNTDLATGWYGV